MKARNMGSRKLLSSVGRSANKKLSGLIDSIEHSDTNVVKEDEAKSRVEIQTLREDPTSLEAMTIQELRDMVRSVGLPSNGSKRVLLSALKQFLAKQENGQSSMVAKGDASLVMKPNQPKNTPPKKKSKISTETDDSQTVNTISEATKIYQNKNKSKPPLIGSDHNGAIIIEQELSIKADRLQDMNTSGAKGRASSRTRSGDGGSPDVVGLSTEPNEPWTVLAHKKPQHGWVPYNPRTMRPPPLSDDTKLVKIMSWNVNGLRALLKLEGFSALQLAEKENFDVLCLQETKLQEKDVEEIKQCLISGYDNSFWTCSVSKLGYSGTAIISRLKPLSVKYGLGMLDHDSEGRLVTVEFDSYYLISGYVPNSGEGLKRLTYRVKQWDPSLSNFLKDLEKLKPVILTGDLNCAHQEIDIYNPAGNRRSAGFTNEERESFEINFLSRGFVDTFRRQHPGVVGYTYWGYRHGGRINNRGWRLDYFLVSESIADKVHDSFILPDVIGSDHCPIGLTLKL